MKVTDKDGKDVNSDIIKKIEKSLEKAGYKFTKGYTSDPDLRKDDPRYTKAEGEEEFTPDLEKDDLQRKAIKQMMDKEKKDAGEFINNRDEEYTEIEQEWDNMGPDERKNLLSDLDALYLLHTHTEFDELKSELGFDFEAAIASYTGVDEPEI